MSALNTNYLVKSYSVVGYQLRADQYCLDCIEDETIKVVNNWTKIDKSIFDNENVIDSEDMLDIIAKKIGIERMDEYTFDSWDFPKVIFADQIDDENIDYCGECQKSIYKVFLGEN
jgi:uncharacterized alpha/beta hydrolase family protein